jgi:hypothetical protein
MKSFRARLTVAAVLALLACVALAGATASKATLQPNKLIILSTTDVKGRTSPCG